MQLYRRGWRLRRATLAKAVLVVRNNAARVLVIPVEDCLRRPSVELHAWDAITPQVDEWLQGLVQTCSASLVAVDGAPGPDGVIFLYSATSEGETSTRDCLWLDHDVALGCLNDADRQLLHLRIAHQDKA